MPSQNTCQVLTENYVLCIFHRGASDILKEGTIKLSTVNISGTSLENFPMSLGIFWPNRTIIYLSAKEAELPVIDGPWNFLN
jgi:hypothetical protein